MENFHHNATQHIAVYWDFENIHASLCAHEYGPTWYAQSKNRLSVQPALVDIKSIMEFISGLGVININKGYANWIFLHKYSNALLHHSVDLIQLFPRGSHGKNGADIRLAIEVVEDLANNDHIDRVVVIGGDSDYISVAQHVRQRGKNIIGIGARETTNRYWVEACNEFKFYSSLLLKTSAIENLVGEYDADDLEDAKELLTKALRQFTSRTGEAAILQARLKPQLMRLDSSFDESNFGFGGFGTFLEACQDVIDIHPGEYDKHISLKGTAGVGSSQPSLIPANPYESILRKQQIRLPRPHVLHTGITASLAIFSETSKLADFAEFKEKLATFLHEVGVPFESSEVSRIKAVLYKAFVFQGYPDRGGIGLHPEIKSEEEFLDRVLGSLIRRVMDNVDLGTFEPSKLAELLAFDDASTAVVLALIEKRLADGSDVSSRYTVA